MADPNAEVAVSGRIGSGAQMFDLPSLAGDPAATGAIGLRFRSGSLVVGIESRDYEGTPLERAEIGVSAEDGQIIVDKAARYLYERGQWSDPKAFIKMA